MNSPFRMFTLLFDRSFSKGLFRQILWLLGIMLIVYFGFIGLSFFGMFYTPGGDGSRGRWYDVLFLLLDPGTLNDSLRSPFATIIALMGVIVFGGMLISVISNVLERRVDSYKKGNTNYSVSNHVVVLGFNKSVPSLLKKINDEKKGAFVLLMTVKDCGYVRDWIHANIDSRQERGRQVENNLIVLSGIRNADDDLERLCLNNNVQEIYILGEENEPVHDAINVGCVEKIAKMMRCKGEKKKIKCHVQLEFDIMLSIMQISEFKPKVKRFWK